MFSLNDSMRYLLYNNKPTDMRKSYHSLSGIVTNILGLIPAMEMYISLSTRTGIGSSCFIGNSEELI